MLEVETVIIDVPEIPTDLVGEMWLAFAFGRVLRALRKHRGYSQDSAAQLCGVDRTEISQFERGKRIPTVVMILRLSSGLNVKPTSVFDATMNVLLAVHDAQAVKGRRSKH